MDVAELTVKDAVVVPSVTELAPAKLVPARVTLVPMEPLAGAKLESVGAGGAVTVKLPELVAVPPGVVTAHWPELAPDGTVAVICVAESTVNVAVVPLRVTALAPKRLVPVSATLVPTQPVVGLKLERVGAATGPVVRVSMAMP
jgi:hypothetical protein